MRQITLTLSRAPGDCIGLATDVPFIACVINLSCTLTITWICRVYSFVL